MLDAVRIGYGEVPGVLSLNEEPTSRSVALDQCTFIGNRAVDIGGAVHWRSVGQNLSEASLFGVRDCEFGRNQAYNGSALGLEGVESIVVL